jgi:hypothetical protein
MKLPIQARPAFVANNPNTGTFGTPELCTWPVAPNVCRFQTTSPRFARKLQQRSGAQLTAWSVTGGYVRIYQERVEPWRARQLVKRYLAANQTPTNGAFSQRISPQSRRKSTAGVRRMSQHNDLKAKIAHGKGRLPLPALMDRLGQQGKKSAEYPEGLDSCVSGFPGSLHICVSVSEGQSLTPEQAKTLEALAARNACTAPNTARKRRFKLVRDLKSIKKAGNGLTMAHLRFTFDQWHRLSLPFVDPAKSREDYWLLFLAELEKAAVPTGEGALEKALERVAKMSLDELPVIPAYPYAPEDLRRLAGLHRELSPSSGNGVHFLSYRDAARVCEGLTQQKAHTMTYALVTLGVIEIVSKGEARRNGGKAAEFRYLLPQTENGEGEEEDQEVLI